MVKVPLGKGAYERLYAGAPVVELLNRWLEANPANPQEGTSILARPGTTQFNLTFDPGSFSDLGPMRGNYTLNGLFNDSLFVVCGSNLYRIAQDLTVTHIAGTINGIGYPEVAWQAGAGYQRLWISDGTLLQYYGGLSSSSGTLSTSKLNAIGTLTKISPIVNGSDQIVIGSTYYIWDSIVNVAGADGTSGHPYIVNPTDTGSILDPLNQLIKALNLTGISGVDYSNTITVGNSSVSAVSNATVPATSIIFTAATPGPLGGKVVFKINGGSALTVTGSGTLTYSGLVPGVDIVEIGSAYYTWGSAFSSVDAGTLAHPFIVNPLNSSKAWDPLSQLILAITGTGTAGVDYSRTLTVPNTLVTATNTDVDSTTGLENLPSTVIAITARTAGVAGNAIVFLITAGSNLTISGSGTLTGGGLHALVNCPMPASKLPLSLTQVSQYVLVSILNSQEFYWVQPGETAIFPLNFASKESSPDDIHCMRAVGDQIMIMGSKSTENWYSTGNIAAPFAPIEGRVYARGVMIGSPVVVDDSVILVGDDGRVYSIGFQSGDSTNAPWGVNKISNNGIEERIRYQNRRQNPL